MNNRIFDRNSYSKKTIETFEILAAYFVDVYYNHLYIEAKVFKTSQKTSNITEGYKHALNAYIQAVENPKMYKRILTGIIDYFESLGFVNINFMQCIDKIIKEFVPEDFFNSVNKQQKIALLKSIIYQINKNFLEKIVRKFLGVIIDNHNDQDNIRVLQDEFIDILFLERENMFHRFVAKSVNNTGSSVNNKILESMQTEIKLLLKEKLNLKKNIVILKKIIIKKEHELQESNTKYNTLLNSNLESLNEITELKSKLNDVSNTYENTEIYEINTNNDQSKSDLYQSADYRINREYNMEHIDQYDNQYDNQYVDDQSNQLDLQQNIPQNTQKNIQEPLPQQEFQNDDTMSMYSSKSHYKQSPLNNEELELFADIL